MLVAVGGVHLGHILRFRRGNVRRRRGLLGSRWLIPALAIGALGAHFGQSIAPGLTGIVAPANRSSALVGQVHFSECRALARTCVVDGDTIRLNGEKIRLLDIDAPEVRDYKCAAEKQLGDRATRRLVEILNAGRVEVVRRGSRDTDEYGRSLRIVEVNGRSAGSILVSEGLARPWSGKRRPWCI